MPYEQAVSAKKADGRSDIYALGATLYHLVTGVVPFPGENHLEVVERKLLGVFSPASAVNPDVPAALDRALEKMLARHPRDRYQTASELIVDLERSGLSTPVLSFADPDLARQDPWLQACLASSGQPTQPDLQVPRKRPADGDGDGWRLRYRDRSGRWCRVRVTTQQLLQRLRENRLPAEAEVCRQGQDSFRPVSAYPEFHELHGGSNGPTRPKRPARPAEGGTDVAGEDQETNRSSPASIPEEEKRAPGGPSFRGSWAWWLVVAGVGAALVVGGVAAVCRTLLICS
jgi:serine/threonine-protein kinase